MAVTSKPSAIAMIPARAGSKRVADKNIKLLNGHPLIAYTIAAAQDSKVFDRVVVSTDSEKYADIARHYGAEVPAMRPKEMAGDASSDIDWVAHVLAALKSQSQEYDAFSILRPTSPFRSPSTIRRAWDAFVTQGRAIDSLRAVEKCGQHPGKMWVIRGSRMHPLMPMNKENVPYHSTQYAALPEVYVQNASLEIAWSDTVTEQGSIAGEVLLPFLTQDYEGFDINSPYDWALLELLVANKEATLPVVSFSCFG